LKTGLKNDGGDEGDKGDKGDKGDEGDEEVNFPIPNSLFQSFLM